MNNLPKYLPPPPDFALSISPEYAWLTVTGLKHIENRSWSVKHRGLIAVHASSRFATLNPQQWIRELHPKAAESVARAGEDGPWWCGAIIGTVELADCFYIGPGEPDEATSAMLDRKAYELGCRVPEPLGVDTWAVGPWCWLLANPVAFNTPIPCRGKQSLWRLSGEQRGQVYAAMKAAAGKYAA